MSEVEHLHSHEHHDGHEHSHHRHHQKGFKGFLHHLGKIKWQKWIVIGAAIAVSLFIIVNSCLPGTQSTNVSNPVVQAAATVINTISPGTIKVEPTISPEFSNGVRKVLGHFSLFGLCGLLTSLSSYYILETYSSKNLGFSFIYSLLYGVGLAVLTEVIQTFVAGRSGEFTDALIDIGGYATGVLIIFIIKLLIYMKKHKRIYV